MKPKTQSTTQLMLLFLFTIVPSHSFYFHLVTTLAKPIFTKTEIEPSTPKTSIEETPIVICPGFANEANDYKSSLIASLEKRGFQSKNIYTLPIKRFDWIRVASGMFDFPNFYTGNCSPTGLSYGWYIKCLKETVDKAYKNCGNKKIILIGHSAGGWLARAAMGDGNWSKDGNDAMDTNIIRTADRIRCLVTVGSIHKEPKNSATCVTKGALMNTNRLYPGAFLKNEGIGYVSVGGYALTGDNTYAESRNKINVPFHEDYKLQISPKVAYKSYKAVAGEGNLDGDGIVPLEWTKLEGSKHVKLEGVLHSAHFARKAKQQNSWYGSENILDNWLTCALDEAGINSRIGTCVKKVRRWGLLRYMQRR